jgi:hypothetical protein
MIELTSYLNSSRIVLGALSRRLRLNISLNRVIRISLSRTSYKSPLISLTGYYKVL